MLQVPKWTRGFEMAALITPRYQALPVLALGGSIGTQSWPGGCIEERITVVESFDELAALDNANVSFVYFVLQ